MSRNTPTIKTTTITTITLLALYCLPLNAQNFQSPATAQNSPPTILPNGEPYVPAGTLYDNGQSNAITSLASQNSDGTFLARSADDFLLPGAACASGLYDISQIRIQMVQRDSAAQPFAIDIFADNGSGTAPTSGITPLHSFPETSQAFIDVFGLGTSLYQASIDTPGLQLNADTVYWISGYGADASANAGGFNNFFASSNGASGTTANGVIIAPDAGIPDWTPTEQVLGPPSLAFSFAIDGACAAGSARAVPTLNGWALWLLVILLGGVLYVQQRRQGISTHRS